MKKSVRRSSGNSRSYSHWLKKSIKRFPCYSDTKPKNPALFAQDDAKTLLQRPAEE
jgi:hypothetical protein